jgi:hypothetical protein
MILSTNEIAFLSGYYTDKTQLSLFANIDATLDGTEEKSLIEKDVCLDGFLSPTARSVLDIVAGARKYSRISLNNRFCELEKCTFKKDDSIVLVEVNEDEMTFSSSENLTGTISEFSEFIGSSRIKSADLEVFMTVAETMVFFAIMDLHRKAALYSYLGYTKSNPGLQFSDIVNQVNNPMKNSLVQIIRTNYNYAMPQKELIGDILGKFVKEKYIVFNKGYELVDQFAVFANGFLIPETIITMELCNMDMNDQFIGFTALCIYAGIKDIVSLIFSKDGVEISSISTQQLLKMIENFLNCPDITI